MKGLILKDWKILRRQGHHYGMALLLICAIAFVGSKNFSSFITSYLTLGKKSVSQEYCLYLAGKPSI